MLNLYTVLLPQLRQECLDYQLQRQHDLPVESNSMYTWYLHNKYLVVLILKVKNSLKMIH